MQKNTRRAVRDLAKGQLGLPQNASHECVPNFYMEELRRHLALYPGAHNFRMTLEPGVGFGRVHCLEDGCGQVIHLIKRIREADGGTKDGMGSLSAYRHHLASHTTNILIKPEPTCSSINENAVKSEPTSPSISHRVLSTSLPSVCTTSPVKLELEPEHYIKPEATEYSVPRKRLSDVAFGIENNQIVSPKKSKIEPTSEKVPLNQVTNTPKASGSRDTDAFDMDFEDEDVGTKLEDVKLAMAGQQHLMERLKRKLHLTHDDFRRFRDCRDEWARLRTMEQRYKAAKASSSQWVKPEIEDRYIPMEVDQKPGVSDFNWGWDRKGKSDSSPVASGSRLPSSASPQPSQNAGSSPMPGSDPVSSSGHIVDQFGIIAPPPIVDDAHDENGDFHGRGRDLFVGPQAGVNDIEEFVKEAGNAESFDGNETVDKALNYLQLSGLQDKIPGMEITLMAHQVMGVAWMLEKEKNNLKGGCLADEMGLGKTVQMMTTMVMNRSKDPARKTTLIVAPLALLDQWKLEIETKTDCGFTCLIYHGPNRTAKSSVLMKYDIVLTTFHTMAHEWPDYETEMKKKAKAKKKGDAFIVSDSDEGDMRNHTYRSHKRKQKAGLLFQVQWYRVIADEGQNIRNRRTRMSRAITDLNSIYRWCLTGTPIVNGLADVYGLIRFLRLRPWYDWTVFHSEISIYEKKNPATAVARLQKIMATFLLRRKKDSKLDGKNLVDLPEKKVELVKLEFSPEEREIYAMVEARSQARFNRYLREGTVLKNYHQVLVLLLRLRQICSHPSLIQEDGVAFVRPDEAEVNPEFATELTRAKRLVSPEFVAKMKAKFLEVARARMERERLSENATIEEDDCPICFDAMTNGVVTGCTHIFCRECIIDVLHQPMPEGVDTGCKPGQRPCPVCRIPISEQSIFDRQAFEPTDEELNPETKKDQDAEMSETEEYAPGDRKGKGKAKAPVAKRPAHARRHVTESDDEGDDIEKLGSDDEAVDEDDDMSDFIVESDEDEEEKDAHRALKKRLGKKRKNIIIDSDDEPETPEEKEVIFGARKKEPMSEEAIKLMPRFLPSSKMKYMMDTLQKRVKSHPEEKTLLVSQWTGCLSLISDYLSEKHIPHVKYQGDMSRHQRDVSVKTFMAKEKARVMLMSLKCGGVGLNLTRANNVISLDLGWSQAVEAQAFDRVHRVGQTREVLVQRVVIADTVEDRILKLQERKQLLADGSLGEGSGKKIGRLSVKELANLFGLDARGRLLRI